MGLLLLQNMPDASYGRNEKLKSRKHIEKLFAEGKSFTVFPIKVFYLRQSMKEGDVLPQAGVGVSARNFRKAVDRNRIKRLLREAYRLQKTDLHQSCEARAEKLILFFLFIGKELPDQTLIAEKMRAALTRLAEPRK